MTTDGALRLSDLCDRIVETVKPRDRPDSIYLGLEQVPSGRLLPAASGRASSVRSTTTAFRDGDVLYGKLRPYLDKAVLAPSDGIGTTELLVLRPRAGVDPRFLVAVLHAPTFLDHAISGTTGSQHPRTSWAHVGSFPVPDFPPRSRRAITDLVWLVHDAVAAVEAAITAGASLRAEAMRTLFTRGLRGEPMKETEIGELPRGWIVESLGQLDDRDAIQITMGQSPPSSAYNESGIGSPFFQGSADFGPLHPTTRIWCDRARKFARAGDTLLSVRAPVGDVNVAREECGIGRGLASIAAGTDFDPWFLYFVLLYRKPSLMALGSGSTFAGVSGATLRQLSLPVPALGEQREIASTLRTVERKMELHRRKLSLLEQMFKTLLHDLMTGQVRVDDLELPTAVAGCEQDSGE